MFEPLAATVLTSVLPSRPLATQFLARRSAFAMTVHTAKRALPSDFFTPHPWSAKGKGKALPVDEYVLYSHVPGRNCPMQHDPVIPRTTAPMTSLNSARPRTRRSVGHKHIASASGRHIPSLRTWVRQADVVQRRHASSRTVVEPTRHPTPPPDDREVWQQQFEHIANGGGDFSVDDAWHAFRCLCDGGHPPPPPRAAVAFLSNLVMSIANGRQGPLSANFLSLWGTRIQEALHHIDPGIEETPQNHLQTRWNHIHIATSAMLGNGKVDEAVAAARAISEQMDPEIERARVLAVYVVLIQALRQHRGPPAVLDFVVQEWQSLGAYFSGPSRSSSHLANAIVLFTSTALDLLSGIENPSQYLAESFPRRDKAELSVAGTLLVRAFSRAQQPREAHAILRAVREEGVELSFEVPLLVARSLAKGKLQDDANALFSTLPLPSPAASNLPHYREYHRTGLFIRSRNGDTDGAQEHYDHLAQKALANFADKGALMHTYATVGNPTHVVELFNGFFLDPERPRRPHIIHYTTVLYAYAQVGDLAGVNTWLGKLHEAGLRPDQHIYSIILHCFASRTDVVSMSNVLDQMGKSGIAMTPVLYSDLITALAKRGDPIAAERLFKHALAEGVRPDRVMVSAIMNAHVEVGSWQGVIRAFDYLNTPGRLGAGVDIHVFNTLMKAYVLIGAPFRVVANLFRRLDSAELRPDSRTFALLIQSACDSGFMDIAEDLYQEMERLVAENARASLKPNIYILTIMMSGYLQQGKRVKAKQIYDKIADLGLQATAVTYGAILKAYSNQKSDQGIKVAEAFLHSLLTKGDEDSWLQMIGGRRLTLETVYRPLMNAYAHQDRPLEVARLRDEMIETGSESTLSTATVLLDAYRRSGDISAVQTIWPEVHRLALEFTRQNALLSPDTDQSPNLRVYGSLLCVPLSILIDALSAAGKHAEIAQTWKTLKDQGLLFDSHNWNHLAVALVRAGEPQRAFDVVENVILRYQRQSRRRLSGERDMHPTSPLTLDLPPPEEGELPPYRPEAPLHASERRTFAAERSTRRLRNNASIEKRGSEDFAHPLQLLYKMSPIWNIWRPHGATLVLLGWVIDYLRSGRLVQAVRPGSDPDMEQTAMDMEEVRGRTEAAGLVLDEIHDRFPQTVQLVREYQIMRSRYKKSKRS